MKQKIYLDNNATTPLDPKVIESIVQNLKTEFGNPSSIHSFGQSARAVLQKARDEIAKILNVMPREIVFTSGATESLNLILRGFLNQKKCHVISSDVEHSAVYSTLKDLEKEGSEITFLKTGLYGAVTLDAVKEAYTPKTGLIVLMAANNETGVKTDIESIASFAKEKKIDFIVDGVAIFGKEPFVILPGISAACFSGHKFHAPKGVGFAFIRKNLLLKPEITGGDQEFGRRAGTENLSGIVGLQTAIKIAFDQMEKNSEKMRVLRDYFESVLLSQLKGISINGLAPRVVNTSNICFHQIDGELLLANLDKQGLAVSLGSACASGALEPSRVLLNMGLSVEDASSSIRFSLSRFTSKEEIDQALEMIIETVTKIRPKRAL